VKFRLSLGNTSRTSFLINRKIYNLPKLNQVKINLTMEVKTSTMKNAKPQRKKLKKTLEDGKTSHVHGSMELIL
jgi:hypothetical protein